MALSPGILKDIGLDFRSGKLSQTEYERRRDACTKKHLNDLTSSPEYMHWMQSRSHTQKQSTSAGDILLFFVIILVAAVIIAQPFISVLEHRKVNSVRLTVTELGRQGISVDLISFTTLFYFQYLSCFVQGLCVRK